MGVFIIIILVDGMVTRSILLLYVQYRSMTRSSAPRADSDLKSTYCFCAHMHEMMKYFLFTEIHKQCLNQLSVPSCESSICRRIDRVTIPSESIPLMQLLLIVTRLRQTAVKLKGSETFYKTKTVVQKISDLQQYSSTCMPQIRISRIPTATVPNNCQL